MSTLALLLLASMRWAEAADAPTAASVPAPAEAPAAVAAPAAAPASAAPAPDATTAPEQSGVVVDRVAAVVNEDIITLGEVYAYGATYIDQVVAAQGEGARGAAEREVIDRLLERRLVAQQMKELKIELTDQDTDRSIAEIAQRNGLDTDGLRKEIEKSGMGWDQYRSELQESLRDMKFAQTVLRPRINITDDELRDAWLRSNPGAPTSARVQALVLALPPNASEADKAAAVAKATKLRDEARAGADFGKLSKANDQGPFGEHDGEMGVFKPGELVEDLDKAIVNTPVGEVSDPIVLGNGVYLLRVAERMSGATDFAAQKDQLAEQVYQSRMEDEKARWFQEARRKAAIRILLPAAAAALPVTSATPKP